MAGAVFAALLLTGGTVACGTGTGGESAREDSPKATPTANSAQALAAVAKTVTSSEDITSLHYRITGTVPDLGAVAAEASMSTKPSALSMTMTKPGGSRRGQLEVRFVDEAMYVGGSAVDTAKLGGKSWSKAAPAVWGGSLVDNQSYDVLPYQFQESPVAQSRIMGGSQDVRLIGTGTVDGATTTHYEGTVTHESLSAASAAATDEAGRQRWIQTLDQFIGLRVSGPLTMDLWIDGDHHTKQFRLRGATRNMLTDEAGDPLDLTVTFLDINQPVAVEAPPAEDTTTLAGDAQAH